MSPSTPTITVYGKAECTDTLRSRALLDAQEVAYEYVDVEHDLASAERAREISGGVAVPVIVIESDVVLVEPSDDVLAAALAH